jgi:hypothetical protein
MLLVCNCNHKTGRCPPPPPRRFSQWRELWLWTMCQNQRVLNDLKRARLLAVVWCGSSPAPPLRSVSSTGGHTGRLRKRDNLLTGGGRGRGRWARSWIIRPQESLVLYKSFNTLGQNSSRNLVGCYFFWMAAYQECVWYLGSLGQSQLHQKRARSSPPPGSWSRNQKSIFSNFFDFLDPDLDSEFTQLNSDPIRIHWHLCNYVRYVIVRILYVLCKYYRRRQLYLHLEI